MGSGSWDIYIKMHVLLSKHLRLWYSRATKAQASLLNVQNRLSLHCSHTQSIDVMKTRAKIKTPYPTRYVSMEDIATVTDPEENQGVQANPRF